MTGGQHEALFGSGRGADDEGSRDDLTGDNGEATMVGGG
jgi:hypothetical protein